jgi:hypothetical protein
MRVTFLSFMFSSTINPNVPKQDISCVTLEWLIRSQYSPWWCEWYSRCTQDEKCLSSTPTLIVTTVSTENSDGFTRAMSKHNTTTRIMLKCSCPMSTAAYPYEKFNLVITQRKL